MGKDREGVFTPAKGKPSGRGQKKGMDSHSDHKAIGNQAKIEEEYSIDEEKLEVAGVHTRHHNRNEDKDRDRKKPDARRKSITSVSDANEIRKEIGGNNGSSSKQNYFYVLILSKKKAKLFRGDQSGFNNIDIPELPNGVADVVHLEEKGGQNIFRTGSSGGGSGAYHGTGSTAPDDKENTSMYLKEVDRTLWAEVLNKESAPLILGGVDYIVAMYRDLSQYKNIADETLSGNLDNEDSQKIYKKAKEIVNPFIASRTSNF